MTAGKPTRAWPIRRFRVTEGSMRPTLVLGDGLIAVRRRRIRRDEIRVFEHPQRPDFWLVKRVGHVRGDRFEAVSDNPDADAFDSRSFGDAPIAGSYRVVLTVRAGGRRGWLRRRARRGARS